MDDDPMLRRILGELLRAGGYATLQAAGAREAIGVLAEEGPTVDALLVDATIAGHDGLALARYTRIRWPHIRSLVMSGLPLSVLVAQGVMDWDASFLPKPFTWDDLRTQLTRVLRAPEQRLRRSGQHRRMEGA